jgi:DNA-binding SARP family transcriptional activator
VDLDLMWASVMTDMHFLIPVTMKTPSGRTLPSQGGTVNNDIVLRLLGPVELRSADAWRQPDRPQQRLVLALMALRAGQVVAVGELIGAVWAETPPRSARASMQVLVTRLRRLLAGTPGSKLERRGEGYRLYLEPDRLDVHRFRSLARAGREAADCRTAVAAFDEALALWRGPALADVPGTAKIEAIRSGLAEEHLSALQDRISAMLGCGLEWEAAAELPGLLARNPLAERLAGMLMVALYRCGQQADALKVFREVRARLVADLGIEPGPELQHMHQRILTGDPDLTAPPLARVSAMPSASAAGRVLAGRVERVVQRQLPTAPSHFAGRSAELQALTRLVNGGADAGGTVMISAISGTAGVGKSTLAVYWGHQVADEFPDGQLYVNLRGFGPSGPPVTSAEAIKGFLAAYQVPSAAVPPGLDTLAGLYRSMLAGTRTLIVLDNARDVDQVRPLLPASPGCLVLVTSRNQLAGLVGNEGARLLTLDVLPEAEAHELLVSRLGPSQVTAEHDAVSEVARLCAGLPLALGIAATRAAARPDFALTALAAELRDGEGRLDALDTGDATGSLREVFSWSHQQLSHSAGRLFRLMSVHPGPDMSVQAAASIAGIAVPDAQRALAELSNASLVAERSPGRYGCHDLLRTYAAEQATDCDGDVEVRAAMNRMLDHYRHRGDRHEWATIQRTAVAAAQRLASPAGPALLTCTAER